MDLSSGQCLVTSCRLISEKNILGAFLDFTCGMAACSWPHGVFSLAQASRAWIRDLIRDPLGADSLIR